MAKSKKKVVQTPDQTTLVTQSNTQSIVDSVWLPALLSCLTLLAAFPPVSFYPLAWIAPLGWLLICQRELPVGRKGYFHLWLCGCLFWLVSLHSIRLAFWVLHFGWIAMSCYLAAYLPLMVAVTRTMVHRWGVPLIVAAPVIWTGFEAIRSVFLTGYSANTLAHSQAWQPLVIQVCDMIGHGGLSFLIILFSAACLQIIRPLLVRSMAVDAPATALDSTISNRPSVKLAMVGGVAVVLSVPFVVLAYGNWRIAQADRELANQRPLLRCLLLQENTPTIFEMNVDPEVYRQRAETAWTQYAKLCRTAAKDHSQIDLVIWPESTFTAFDPYYEVEYVGDRLPDWLLKELRFYGKSPMEFETDLRISQQHFDLKTRIALLASRGLDVMDQLPTEPGPDMLVGCDHLRYGTDKVRRHAGALWIAEDGSIKGTYAKMHLVMFGEFIPLRPLLGWLENVFGFAGSDPGDKPKIFKIKDIQVAPNICFETMVPRLIHWQIRQLKSQGTDPQLLVNLTNDSWFKGTSMLDHHLASSIICCVENRRPMLVAANTGLTAEIDGSGRLLQCTQRLTAQAVLAEPRADGRWGVVQSMGYPLSWLCISVTLIALVIGAWHRK